MCRRFNSVPGHKVGGSSHVGGRLIRVAPLSVSVARAPPRRCRRLRESLRVVPASAGAAGTVTFARAIRRAFVAVFGVSVVAGVAQRRRSRRRSGPRGSRCSRVGVFTLSSSHSSGGWMTVPARRESAPVVHTSVSSSSASSHSSLISLMPSPQKVLRHWRRWYRD